MNHLKEDCPIGVDVQHTFVSFSQGEGADLALKGRNVLLESDLAIQYLKNTIHIDEQYDHRANRIKFDLQAQADLLIAAKQNETSNDPALAKLQDLFAKENILREHAETRREVLIRHHVSRKNTWETCRKKSIVKAASAWLSLSHYEP